MDNAAQKNSKPNKLLVEILHLIIKISLVVLLVGLVLTFIFSIEKLEDNSMSPALKGGDLVLCYRIGNDYHAGDVVSIDYESEYQLRRVVAIEGDTVDITDEGLLINGALQQEKGVLHETLLYEGGVTLPLTLQADEVFVLGDNRLESLDSRMYGPVNIKHIAGKAIGVVRTKNL